MPPKQSLPCLEKRSLAQLHEHPRQRVFFGDYDPDLIERLAAQIGENGLANPIEILARNRAGLRINTILRGHKRRLALLKLGEKTASVLVRHDLADSEPDSIEKVFLADNFDRQQLDRLAQARIGLRLLEIELGRPAGKLHRCEEGEARDRVGKLLGMSGRNLGRYLAVLRSPLPVQEAFQGQMLSLVEAAAVGGLSTATQEEIATQMSQGEAPREVVRAYLDVRQPEGQKVRNDLMVFLRGLQRAGGVRRGLELLSAHEVATYRPLLENGARTIEALLRHGTSP